MSDRAYYHTWGCQPAAEPFRVERAEGDEFVLEDGRRIYDFISTSFQTNFGHSHPLIRDAVRRQLETMPIASPRAAFELKERASARLNDAVGLPGGKVFYTVSGSESVENALKMARQITGRTKIAARKKSYHGASLGALSVTGDWRNQPHFTLDEQTVRIPEPDEDPDLETTRRIFAEVGGDHIAALILETISGTNGVAIPPQSWYDGLTELCRAHGVLLIIDEVLCGFGRTGPLFAFQPYQLQPDLICMSKGITGGYIPFGAVWTGPRVVDYYGVEPLTCGLTSYAHPLGLAALDAVMDIFSDQAFQQNKSALENQLAQTLDEVANWESVREVRCRGLLAAIELDRPGPSWDVLFHHGLHAYSKSNTLIIAPPLVSTPQRLARATQTLLDLLQGSMVV